MRRTRESLVSEGVQRTIEVREDRNYDWIVALLCLLGGLAGLRVFTDASIWSARDGGEGQTVARLKRQTGVIRFRPNDSLAWRDISDASQSLVVKDTVFTGPDGIAELTWEESGDVTTVLPNSLVVIRDPREGQAQDGWLKFFFKPLVEAPAPAVIEVAQGEVRVKRATGKKAPDPAKATQVIAAGKKFSGEVQVTSAGVSTPALPLTPVLRALSPASGSTLYSDVPSLSGETTVDFSWEGKAARITVTPEDAGGSTRTITPAAGDTSASVSLKSGRYRWKLEGEEGVAKNPIPFRVARFGAPNPVGPVDRAHLPIERKGGKSAEKRTVVLSWEPVDPTFETELELKADGASAPRIETLGGKTVSYDLAAGTYSWRLRSAHIDGRLSSWSATRSFTIPVPPAPEPEKAPVTPAQGAAPAPGAAPAQGAVPVQGAPAKETPLPSTLLPSTLKLSQPDSAPAAASPDAAAATGKPDAAKLEATKLEAAKLEVPAKGGDAVAPKPAGILPGPLEALKRAEAEAQSKAKELEAKEQLAKAEAEAKLKKPRILPRLTVGGVKASTRLGANEDLRRIPVTLAWSPVEGAKEYEVSVFLGNVPKVKETVKTPKFGFKLDMLSKETYSYQVSAELESGDRVSSTRVALEIELSDPLPKSPRDGFRTALGQENLLTWEKTLLTEGYRLQISRDESFRTPMTDLKTGENFYVFPSSKPGTYYWRVKSLGQERESPWSKKSAIVIESSREPASH